LNPEVVKSFRDDLPTEDTLSRSAEEVFKFQEKNKLKTKDMANGELPNFEHSKPLIGDDCFQLGRMAYNSEDYYHSAVWMEEAMERMKLKKEFTMKDSVDALDYLSFSYYKMGNFQRAYWMTQTLVKLDPENKRALDNIAFYEQDIKKAGLSVPKNETDLPPIKYNTDYRKKEKKPTTKPPAKKKEGGPQKPKEDAGKKKKAAKKDAPKKGRTVNALLSLFSIMQ